MSQSFNTEQLSQTVTLKDFRHIQRRIQEINKTPSSAEKAKLQDKLDSYVQEAGNRFAQRQQISCLIAYPESLPVAQRAGEIKKAIESNQVVIVAGETGSGKTTQLPKICLEAGLGRYGLIGHTQPRRLAARSVANRLAEEMQVTLGDVVGFQVRFTDDVSDRTLVKVMTDGILLSEIKRDPYLNNYDCIIVDEAHERSLNIDFLLGYLKQLLPKRPELKLVITSATIDVERFSEHFGKAPVVQVEGRSYPVDVIYRPPIEQGEDAQAGLPEQIAQTLEEIVDEEKSRGWGMGDVLVFLPGEREIREVARHLRHLDWRDTEITPLYARLNSAEQQKIFSPHRGRRVVLATNVAETSITVPGIRYVIDPGLARLSRYSVRSKLQRLPIEAISQASANQRAGRCGRVAEGICYRLYSEQDFLGRPEFTDPEILRTNLAAVILKMLDLGLGDSVRSFPFIEPPDHRLWNDGFKLLFELGAVNARHKLSRLGRRLSHLPVDPRLGRMVLEADSYGCLNEVLIIVSALAIQDPRERPADKQQAADQSHADYKDKDSDFVSLLNLWNHFEAKRQELGSNQLKRYCQKRYLSYVRMREWRDLHRQLLLACRQIKCSVNNAAADYDSVHKALLSGLLGHVGNHDERREYKGCRNRRFQIFPGSALAKTKPKWLVAAELIETSQVYARVCARINVDWIEPLAEHLVKKSWSEAHWQKKRGQVLAYEKVSLYGLEIVSRRLINYAKINEIEAREIFIRSALVEAEYDCRIAEIKANRRLVEKLEAIEDRTRRRDVLVDDEALYGLYDKRIPAHIVSAASFEKWVKTLPEGERKSLLISREELQREQAADFDPALFPDHLENNGIRFPLSYHFNPGEQNDGITLGVPVSAVRQITAGRIERLVPGLLREKCLQLIKQLPRTLRKHCVPVPDLVDKILPELESRDDNLLEALTGLLKRHKGIDVPYDAWQPELLDDHLRFNLQILDTNGRVLEQGRDLVSLVDKVEHLIDAVPSAQANTLETIQAQEWLFGDIPQSIDVKQAGIGMAMYPALLDKQKHVENVLVSNAGKAEYLTILGIARLYLFRLADQRQMLEKQLNNLKKIGLYYAPVGQARQLYDDFFLASARQHFLDGKPLPRDKSTFDAVWEQHRGDYVDATREFALLVERILASFHDLMKQLKGKMNLSLAMPMADLQHQLSHLIFPGFLAGSGAQRLEQYPRYLEAAVIRMDKMPREMGNERKYVPELTQWWKQYEERKKLLEKQGIYDPALEEFRWMLEEQRVSWYAQQLGTAVTISPKRLARQWETVRKA